MIELTLSDSTTTATIVLPHPPLTQTDSNLDVKKRTLDNSLHVYIAPNADKRIWTQTWEYLKIAEYTLIRGFRDRQRTLYTFPELSITGLSTGDIVNVPVFITMEEKNIIDNCETVENVNVVFEES